MPNPFQPRLRFTGRAEVPRQHRAAPPVWVPAADDLPPPDAVPSVLGGCDRCPAAARLALRSVQVFAPEGWDRDQVASVREIHLCGHHGDCHEDALLDAGWVTIHDSRSALVAREAR